MNHEKILLTIFGTFTLILILIILRYYFQQILYLEGFTSDESNTYTKLPGVFSKGKVRNFDSDSDVKLKRGKWKKQSLSQCQSLCNEIDQCQGFYRHNKLSDDQEGGCYPITDLDCQTEYRAIDRNHQRKAQQYTTYLKTNLFPDIPTKCFSEHHFNQPVSIRVQTNPYQYWFYNDNDEIELLTQNAIANSQLYPNLQFKLEAGSKPRTVQIHPIKDYDSARKNLTHNFPRESAITASNNSNSFIVVPGLKNSDFISFKLVPNGKLDGADYYLFASEGKLEVSQNISGREGLATFEIIKPLEATSIKSPDQYQPINSTIQTSPELEQIIGTPLLTPSEQLSEMVQKNDNLISSMENSITKANMYLNTLTQYNDQRLDNIDRTIDKQMIGDNIEKFYKIKKEVMDIENKL